MFRITRLRAGLLTGWLILLPGLTAKPATLAEPPSQVQVARRFLLAVLAGRRTAAYRMLAPETKAHLSADGFATAVQPLYAEGQRRGMTIDLYKFGFRIGDTDTQPFCAFMFRSDTTAAKPQVQLDVRFASKDAREVLEFSLVQASVEPAR